MRDHDPLSHGEAMAYRRGQRAGLSLAALAIAAMAFVSLLSVEKSLLALVIALVALRGDLDRRARRWARLAIGLAIFHWVALAVIISLFHRQLEQLLVLLQKLS